MTHNLSRRLGKLLFPHLPRDQRQYRMAVALFVLIVSLIVAGTLGVLMLHLGKL